jgi:WD domain, G-beta repeat
VKLEKPRDIHLPTGVLALAGAADGSRLYAACMDGRVFEVEPVGGAVTPFAGAHTSFASGCVLLPDGKTLLTGGYDGCLLWHDVETRQEVRRVKAHDFWSWRLVCSPEGERVVSVTGQYLAGGEKYEPAPAGEPAVKVYDTRTGDLLQAFEHVPPVLSAGFSPDGQYLAAGNMMGEVRVWDVVSGQQTAQFSTPDFTSWGIIKSPYYCGGIYGVAFAAWRESPPKMLAQIHEGQGGSGLMEILAPHPDGRTFLMAGRQAQGTWNAALFSAEGELIASLDTKSRVTGAHFAPGGKELFLGAAVSQPKREADGTWPDYGRIHVTQITG